VADFIGQANFVPAAVIDKDTVEIAGVRMTVPGTAGASKGREVTVLVRPEAIGLSTQKGTFPGTVTRAMFLGNSAEYVVDLGAAGSWMVDRANPAETALHEVGERVFLTPSRNALHIVTA
jgi:ABC-type Fe3+/spermidine/putrescine transport system ATPase subunit